MLTVLILDYLNKSIKTNLQQESCNFIGQGERGEKLRYFQYVATHEATFHHCIAVVARLAAILQQQLHVTIFYGWQQLVR